MGTRASFDVMEKRKLSYSCQDLNPQSSNAQPRHYTELVIMPPPQCINLPIPYLYIVIFWFADQVPYLCHARCTSSAILLWHYILLLMESILLCLIHTDTDYSVLTQHFIVIFKCFYI
jgi:hypothetical protein